MSETPGHAFGAPGIAPTWSSSDKDFVTAALNGSRLWASIGHGIVNEVYWPSTGQPQIRDLSFYLVGKGHWIDLKRARRYHLLTPGPALPALNIVHHGDDYQLTLEILPAPLRDVLLVRFALVGDYRLVFLLAPHLGSSGRDNCAWLDDGAAYAQGGPFALCLAASTPIEHLSCGFAGASDGWQDLNRHGALTYQFKSASHGTVAITGQASRHRGVLALGFADSPSGAQTRARTALAADFDALRSAFIEAWHGWGATLILPRPDETLGDAAAGRGKPEHGDTHTCVVHNCAFRRCITPPGAQEAGRTDSLRGARAARYLERPAHGRQRPSPSVGYLADCLPPTIPV